MLTRAQVRRAFFHALGAVTLGGLALLAGVDPHGRVGVGTEAHATISELVSLDELVGKSSFVVVGQPVERVSKWEQLGGSKRIVTYTRIVLEQSIVGDPGEKEIWVRTLGGKVDNIGQAVAGEAQFTIGETSVIFVAKAAGALVVTAMAQGHFPLVATTTDRVLTSSPDTGTLIPPKKDAAANGKPKSARDELLGSSLTDAVARITKAKKASK